MRDNPFYQWNVAHAYAYRPTLLPAGSTLQSWLLNILQLMILFQDGVDHRPKPEVPCHKTERVQETFPGLWRGAWGCILAWRLPALKTQAKHCPSPQAATASHGTGRSELILLLTGGQSHQAKWRCSVRRKLLHRVKYSISHQKTWKHH